MKKCVSEKVAAIVICSFASLFYVYDYFIQVSPAVITHQLMASFSIGAAGLSVLGSCFFYTYAGMQIPAGMLLDKFGARKLLSIAIFISGFGVLLFGLTNSFFVASVSRLFVGFGSAFSFIGALFLASRWFPHNRFALIAGLVQFAGCLGSIFGEAPLAATINHFGWRETMIVIGIVTFVIALLFWLIIRDQPKINIQSSKQEKYVGSLKALGLLVKNSQVLWIALLGFVSWMPVATVGALWGVPYLMKVYSFTNTHAAAYISLFWIGLGLGSPLIGWFSDKIKTRKTPFYICFASGIFGAILFVFANRLPIEITAFALILLGASAAIQSLTFAVAKDFLPRTIFGTAAGLINMAPIVGGALSQVFVGVLLSLLWGHQIHNGVPTYNIQTYQFGMLILVVAAIVGFVITYKKLDETYHHAVDDLDPVNV